MFVYNKMSSVYDFGFEFNFLTGGDHYHENDRGNVRSNYNTLNVMITDFQN